MNTNLLDLNNDVLNIIGDYVKKDYNDCLTIPIDINIKDEEVEISRTLDKNSIIEVISKYNKELASEINKMSICKIEHVKTINAYKSSLEPLTEAYDSNIKYFHYKFKKYYMLNRDIVNIVICHLLNCSWISVYYDSHYKKTG